MPIFLMRVDRGLSRLHARLGSRRIGSDDHGLAKRIDTYVEGRTYFAYVLRHDESAPRRSDAEEVVVD